MGALAGGLSFAGDEASEVSGTVVDISRVAESGMYAMRVRPETEAALSLGVNVTMRL